MKRKVANLSPFTFQSDFTPPEGPAEDKGDIVLTADELSALLADARDSTAALVKDDTLKAHAQDAENLSDQLKTALEQVITLTRHLDKAALNEEERRTALENVRRLATTLIDGQADLFETSNDASTV